MLFSACKKDNNAGDTKTEVKKYDVTFTVAGFTQSVTELQAPVKKTMDIGIP
jgi:hypothetical protein